MAERVFSISLLSSSSADGSMAAPGSAASATRTPGLARWWSSPFFDALLAGHLNDMASVVQVSGRPWPEALDALKQMKGESVLGQTVVSALHGTAAQVGRCAAFTRSARMAVLVNRYHQSHGQPPGTQDDVVPAHAESLPADPFTGRRLMYHLDNTGYTIYSVSENRADDGGDVNRSSGAQPKDWGVRVRVRGASP